MKIGTKSLLFGAHQFLLHPLTVLWGWKNLFGWPKDFRIYVGILIHDWGYWGMDSMDDAKGEEHPLWAARFMGNTFGSDWWIFVYYHSRFLAKRDHHVISPLCLADKISFIYVPSWLYLFMTDMTGETRVYMAKAHTKYEHMRLNTLTPALWHKGICTFLIKWVREHKNFEPDYDTVLEGEKNSNGS
jgi:hypothetical protein